MRDAWRITVADLHAAVDLGDVEAPLLQFPDEIIQGIFVLGEDEQFHLRIVEYALLSDHLSELGEFGLDFTGLKQKRMVDQFAQLGYFLSQCGRVDVEDDLFQRSMISCCSSSGRSS